MKHIALDFWDCADFGQFLFLQKVCAIVGAVVCTAIVHVVHVVPSIIGRHIPFCTTGFKLAQLVKTAPKRDRFIEDLENDILRRVLFRSILSFFGVHAKPSEWAWQLIKGTRAGETREGRLRRFDKAIAWFVDGI